MLFLVVFLKKLLKAFNASATSVEATVWSVESPLHSCGKWISQSYKVWFLACSVKKKKKKKTTSSKKEFLRTFLYLWVILVYFLLDLPKKNSSSREHPEVSWDPAETVVYDRAETFGERGCYRSGSGQPHFVAADACCLLLLPCREFSRPTNVTGGVRRPRQRQC